MNQIKWGSDDVKRSIAFYGPFCHICGLILDFRPNSEPRLRCTRDHLTPKSQGGVKGVNGEHIRLAHSYCNNKRGDREITEDLRYKCRDWILKNYGSVILDAEDYSRITVSANMVKYLACRGTDLPGKNLQTPLALWGFWVDREVKKVLDKVSV